MAGAAPRPPDMAEWREDLDALSFRPEGHGGHCMVHRLALRTLMRREPSPADCLAFWETHRHAFAAAAAAKIGSARLAADANFHVTSRDIRTALAQPASA